MGKAIVADAANKANVINKIIAANKIIVTANKTIVVDKKVILDNEAIVINKVIAVDKAILTNEAIVANKAKINKAIWFCRGFLYSLTKYFAICEEVKGYFEIFGHSNQLLRMVWSCLHSLKCQHLLRVK